LQISNVFTENFDTTTPSSQWTIGSDLTPSPGPALTWHSTGGNPNFRFVNYSPRCAERRFEFFDSLIHRLIGRHSDNARVRIRGHYVLPM
jgi:hypothetical protein